MLDELESPELMLLDEYRRAAGPTADVEERLLARIYDEVDTDDEDAVVEPMAARSHTRPMTTALIAVTAFAAGVIIALGLRADVLQQLVPDVRPSSAPMQREEPRPSKVRPETPPPAAGAVCPAPATSGQAAPAPAEEDAVDDEEPRQRRADPVQEQVPVRAGEQQGDDESRADDRRRRDTARSVVVAVAPWSAPAGARGRGTEPRRSGRRRPIGGWSRSGGWTPSRGRPSPSGGAPAPGSGRPSPGTGGSPAPGNGQGNGSGNGQDGPQTGEPPPMPPPPPPDDRPPVDPSDPPPDDPPQPWEPEEPVDPQPGDFCLDEHMQCTLDADTLCLQPPGDPQLCEVEYQVCDQQLDDCMGLEPWTCEDDVAQCFDMAFAMCEFDPASCEVYLEQCDMMQLDCYG